MTSGRKSRGAPLHRLQEKPSFATEFRTRRQPWLLWLVVVVVGAFLVVGFLFTRYGGIPFRAWFTPTASTCLLLIGYLTWTKTSPRCPNCNRNIRSCRAFHCHVCGEVLTDKRCEQCGGEDQPAGGAFGATSPNPGNKPAISYCPGCGVHLDTQLRRRRIGGG
jgi:hypothetical protein